MFLDFQPCRARSLPILSHTRVLKIGLQEAVLVLVATRSSGGLITGSVIALDRACPRLLVFANALCGCDGLEWNFFGGLSAPQQNEASVSTAQVITVADCLATFCRPSAIFEIFYQVRAASQSALVPNARRP